MKNLRKILVATDLSDTSRRGLLYACSVAADQKATLMVMHVANEFAAWEYYSDEFPLGCQGKTWPRDRMLAEANLDLTHFLEQHLEAMKLIPSVAKRVTLGPVAQRIAEVAAAEHADLIVLSPRRHHGLRWLFAGSITADVTRLSPCPVLAVTSPLHPPLWRGRLLSRGFRWPRVFAADI